MSKSSYTGITGATDAHVSCKVSTNKLFLEVQFQVFVSTIVVAANWSKHSGVE